MVIKAAFRRLRFLLAPIRICAQRIPWLKSMSWNLQYRNAASWNLQYRFGRWDYLDSETAATELLKIIRRYNEQPRILDLGCGKGANLPLVPGTYRSYHGVDISAVAINRARSLKRPNTTYEIADILDYRPPESYDTILLIEVIYYLPVWQIPQFLRRLSVSLAPGGVMIVVICHVGKNHNRIEAAIYDSGLATTTERIAPADDHPRTLYIMAPEAYARSAPVRLGGRRRLYVVRSTW